MSGPTLLIGLALLACVGAVGYLAVAPPNLGALVARANPAVDYAEAVQRVSALRAQEAAGYNPLCHTQLLTHGQKAARAIAFVHGYTNCPNQFLRLGKVFYERGYNVLLAPMPHHGLADLVTDEPSKLTAEALAEYGEQLVDILRGLGEHVTVGGLSAGGVVSAWAAQTRPDLDLAVLIAPGLGLKPIPSPVTVLAVNLVSRLPDFYLWWDSLVHFDKTPPPPLDPKAVQGYPRFSAHGLAQQLRLSLATQALARRAAPATRKILVITNGADLAVDNAVAARLAAEWRAQGAANVETYEFPASLKLAHDLIDPGREDQHVDIVYPKLIELIDRQVQPRKT